MIILTTAAFYIVLLGILLTLIGLATFKDNLLIWGIVLCFTAVLMGIGSASIALTKNTNKTEKWE